LGINSTNNEIKLNEGFVKKTISLKLINRDPNKVRGWTKIEKLKNRGGDIHLAPESMVPV